MRFIYMDESGISGHEPIAVVGGVIVHSDTQVVPLEAHLLDLIEKHIPKNDRAGFVFHAKDIWAGGKYFKNHDEWPWERRAAILDDLAAIPEKLEIPVVFGQMPRARVIEHHVGASQMSPHELSITTHAVAFLHCVLNVEELMRANWPDEIAQLVSEDNSDARAAIKGSYALMRDPTDGVHRSQLLPLKKILGPVLFAEKTESRPLQLADTCAFFIRRRLARNDEKSRHFYSKIQRMMLLVPWTDELAEADLRTVYPFGPLIMASHK